MLKLALPILTPAIVSPAAQFKGCTPAGARQGDKRRETRASDCVPDLQQVGFEVGSEEGPVEFFVIHHLEKPTENKPMANRVPRNLSLSGRLLLAAFAVSVQP